MASRQAATYIASRQAVTYIASRQAVTYIASRQASTYIASRQAATCIASQQASTCIAIRQASTYIASRQAATHIASQPVVTHFLDGVNFSVIVLAQRGYCYKQTHCEGDNRCIDSLSSSIYCNCGRGHTEHKSIPMAILRHVSRHQKILQSHLDSSVPNSRIK